MMQLKLGWMRFVLLGLGFLALLVALGLGWAFWYVGQPAFRAQLIAAVEQQTGRAFSVDGRLHVALWPVAGVSAEDIRLANVAGGAADAFVRAGEVDIGFDPGALLRDGLEIRRIYLEEPTVNLEVDATGRGNWLLGPVAPVSPAPRAPSAPAPAPTDVAIDSLQIVGGVVSYLDRRTNQTYGLQALDFKSRVTSLDAPMAVDASFVFRDQPVTLKGSIAQPRAMQSGRTTPFVFNAESQLLTLSFDGEVTAASGSISGRINAAGPDLRGLVRWAGFGFPEGRLLQQFDVAGLLTVGPQRYNFEDAAIGIDGVDARGDFALELNRERPRLSGALAVDRLDLNAYLRDQPVLAEGASVGSDAVVAEPAAMDVSAASWGQAPIRLEILRSLDLALDLQTGPITAFATTVDRSALTLRLDNGLLGASIQDIGLYGGSGSGTIVIDGRSSVPGFSSDLALDGVGVQRFLRDTFGFGALEGSGQIRLALEASGANQDALVRSLRGRAGLALNQGAITGVDIGGLSETIGRAMRNELAQPTARTSFSGLSMSVSMANGRMGFTDFQMFLDRIRMGGSGVIDLAQRRLDLRFTPRAQIVTTPFTMRGPFGALAFESDLRGRSRAEIEGLARAVAVAERATGSVR
jgi:AsmA protein